MRSSFLPILLLPCVPQHAGAAAPSTATCTIDLIAPEYAGDHVALHLYADLVTDRLVMVARTRIDASGHARLVAEVSGTAKARIRLNIRHCDLFLRPGAHYTIQLPYAEAGPATINGTMQLVPTFQDLDPFDVNALVSDLNTRIDDFLAEGLATDEGAGMDVVDSLKTDGPRNEKVRSDRQPVDLSVLPTPSAQRVDTFYMKLRKFYAGVKDPWFWSYLDHSIAGLRLGPKTDQAKLFERYVKDRPIAYDDPEQVRFLQNFFADHLMTQVFRRHDEELKAYVKAGAADSVMALLADHDFLRNDRRLCELVMIMDLYLEYHGKTFDRTGIEMILSSVKDRSAVVEHRTIATDMLWDITTMRTGGTFPSLALPGVNGDTTQLDELLVGATCIAITAAWCTYCEVEMEALEKLYKDYGTTVRFVVIDVDTTWQTFTRYAKADPERRWTWLRAGDDPGFMDQLRLRTVPAFFLLNDRTIAQSPAPLPSQGMAEIFYKLKVEAEQQNKIRFGNEPPPPKR